MLSQELRDRDALTDGPVFDRGIVDIYEEIFGADPRAFAEQFRQPCEQGLLLFCRPGVEDGDLDVGRDRRCDARRRRGRTGSWKVRAPSGS